MNKKALLMDAKSFLESRPDNPNNPIAAALAMGLSGLPTPATALSAALVKLVFEVANFL